MKITGQILKENRERKNITLSEVSLSTKITIRTLVAIEGGDPANLPPKTFLRGFVRSYAQYLGLDVEEILRTFQEEMGSTLSRSTAPGVSPSELNAEATESATSGDSKPTTAVKNPDLLDRVLGFFPKTIAMPHDPQAALNNETSFATKMIIGVAIVALLGMIWFFKSKMDRYEDERVSADAAVQTAADPLATESPEAVQPEAATDGSEATETAGQEPPEPTSETAAGVTIPAGTPSPTPKPSPSATPSPTPKPTASPKPSPSPTPTPKPSATPKPTPSPTPTPSSTPSPTPKPSATPAPVTAATKEILIEALDNVDIEAIVDGEPARSLKLKPEQIQSLKIKRKAILKISDGGAVNLIVNGVDRGVPGDLGKPTKVELP